MFGSVEAILAFVGVLITATVSVIGFAVTRHSDRRLLQEHDDEQRRLRLDAAMRAGGLFEPSGEGMTHPASVASGLLALTKLDHADLAVALLVDLRSGDRGSVSTETAVLVIDAGAAIRTTEGPARRG
jgi:hypothetical protein